MRRMGRMSTIVGISRIFLINKIRKDRLDKKDRKELSKAQEGIYSFLKFHLIAKLPVWRQIKLPFLASFSQKFSTLLMNTFSKF
jgi:hypothetical protein